MGAGAQTSRTHWLSSSKGLHSSSIANTNFPRWLVYYCIESSNADKEKLFIQEVSQIRVEWLTELIPDYFEDTKQADVETQRQKELSIREVVQPKRVKETTEPVQKPKHFPHSSP